MDGIRKPVGEITSVFEECLHIKGVAIRSRTREKPGLILDNVVVRSEGNRSK